MRPTAFASTLAQADAAFDDSINDSQGGLAPDVSRIVIVNDANANMGLGVYFNNRPTCVGAGDLLFAYFDVDQNPSTGAAPFGVDYALGIDGGARTYGSFRWDGTTLQPVVVGSLSASCDPAGFNAWFLNAREIAIGSGFNFAVVGAYRDAAGTTYTDTAPDSGVWNYQLSSAPTPPPPPPPPTPPPPRPSPPPPPAPVRTFADAPRLPLRARFVGDSIRHGPAGTTTRATTRLVWSAKPLQVACWSQRDWGSAVRDVGGNPNNVAGVWFRRQPGFVHVAAPVCGHIQALIGTRRANVARAVMSAVLLHEASHRNGVDNEAQATCYGVQLVYYFARRLRLSPAESLKMERLAVRNVKKFVANGYWSSSRCRDGGVWDLDDEGANLSY